MTDMFIRRFSRTTCASAVLSSFPGCRKSKSSSEGAGGQRNNRSHSTRTTEPRRKFGGMLPSEAILSPGLGQWIPTVMERGTNAMSITCENGRQGIFSVRFATMEENDATESNPRLRESRTLLAHQHRVLDPGELAKKVIARGIFHRRSSPCPLVYAVSASVSGPLPPPRGRCQSLKLPRNCKTFWRKKGCAA